MQMAEEPMKGEACEDETKIHKNAWMRERLYLF